MPHCPWHASSTQSLLSQPALCLAADSPWPFYWAMVLGLASFPTSPPWRAILPGSTGASVLTVTAFDKWCPLASQPQLYFLWLVSIWLPPSPRLWASWVWRSQPLFWPVSSVPRMFWILTVCMLIGKYEQQWITIALKSWAYIPSTAKSGHKLWEAIMPRRGWPPCPSGDGHFPHTQSLKDGSWIELRPIFYLRTISCLWCRGRNPERVS